jgi:hypothetical protein
MTNQVKEYEKTVEFFVLKITSYFLKTRKGVQAALELVKKDSS